MESEIHALLAAARTVAQEGLSHGTSGNLSLRSGDYLWITPSGMPFESLQPEDLCCLSLADADVVSGKRRPSTEWPLHQAVYRARPAVGAVVHTHSRYATVLAVLRRPLPLIHYQVARLGQEIPVAPYHPFGTEALADAAVAVLGTGGAVLLANHGLITVGADVNDALNAARDVEWAAEIYCRAAAVATPFVLSEAERQDVLKNWTRYGQIKD